MSEDDAPRERRAERSARSRRGPRLASALAGAGLLVVLGFALGVVAGLVMEEPDLLLDYVTGRTREVEVATAEPASAPPDVAASPPAEAAPPAEFEAGAEATGEPLAQAPEPSEAPAPIAEAPAAVEAAAPEPAPAPEPPAELAAVAPAGGFAVQVGAFADAAAAEQLARRLREKGHPVYVAPSAAGADTARWRVRVGPLASRAEAEGVAARLEREERVSTWVLAESPL